MVVATVYTVVTDGHKVTGLALLLNEGPVVVYVTPPESVAVAQLPLHIVVDEIAAVTTGLGFTVILTVLVMTQPVELIPVTV